MTDQKFTLNIYKDDLVSFNKDDQVSFVTLTGPPGAECYYNRWINNHDLPILLSICESPSKAIMYLNHEDCYMVDMVRFILKRCKESITVQYKPFE